MIKVKILSASTAKELSNIINVELKTMVFDVKDIKYQIDSNNVHYAMIVYEK